MVKPTLAEFQSLWPTCGRQRKMAETLDQKIKRHCISVTLSNSSGRPSLRGNRDERKTWSTLHLLSAENAGLPKQDLPAWQRSCCITRCRSVTDSADRHVRYRQRDKCGVIGMKPDLSGGKSNSMRGFKDCWGCADADRNNSRNKPRVCGEPYAATNGTYGFGRGDTGDPVKRATGPYLTEQASNKMRRTYY